MPSDLCILETCRPDLYDAGLSVVIFLEQNEAQPVDRGISNCVQGIALFIGL